jgi:hypothetical protein
MKWARVKDIGLTPCTLFLATGNLTDKPAPRHPVHWPNGSDLDWVMQKLVFHRQNLHAA